MLYTRRLDINLCSAYNNTLPLDNTYEAIMKCLPDGYELYRRSDSQMVLYGAFLSSYEFKYIRNSPDTGPGDMTYSPASNFFPHAEWLYQRTVEKKCQCVCCQGSCISLVSDGNDNIATARYATDAELNRMKKGDLQILCSSGLQMDASYLNFTRAQLINAILEHRSIEIICHRYIQEQVGRMISFTLPPV